MKSVLIVLLALSSSAAFANFDLNDVESIYCQDAAPTKDLNVTFSTNEPSYKRQPNQIPYKYGNQVWKYTSQTGVVAVASQSTDGSVVLEDKYLPDVVQTLRLVPGPSPGAYMGFLTGHVELTTDKWIKIQDHALNCVVSTPRILR